MRARERCGVGRLAELEKRAGQSGFLKNPVPAVRLRVVLAVPLQLLGELLPLGGSDERSLNGQRTRHRLSGGIGEALQSLLDGGEKLVRVGAIHDAVVEREREVGTRSNGDRVLAIRTRDDLRPLLDRAETEDG